MNLQDGTNDRRSPYGGIKCPKSDREVVNNKMCSRLRNEKSVKQSPKSVKRKMVKRNDIKLLSPKSPRCNIRVKQQLKSSEKQHHLMSTKRNDSNIVSKLINTFKQNPESMNSFKPYNDKIIESD